MGLHGDKNALSGLVAESKVKIVARRAGVKSLKIRFHCRQASDPAPARFRPERKQATWLFPLPANAATGLVRAPVPQPGRCTPGSFRAHCDARRCNGAAAGPFVAGGPLVLPRS
jgi:hypothetical protein